MEYNIALREMRRLKEKIRMTVSLDKTLFDGVDMAINALNKQIPLKVTLGNYNYDDDSYSLNCPLCKETNGSLDNEDNDGTYKYNIYGNYCQKCGQNLVQKYNAEDYKLWGIKCK